MGPHNTSDDPTRYVDPVELEEHRAFDPVARVRRYLTAEGLIDEASEQALVEELRAEVDAAFAEAQASAPPGAGGDLRPRLRAPAGAPGAPAQRRRREEAALMAEMTMIEAIRSTLGDALEADERVIVLGQDVGVNGGVFRATEGLQERFGDDRVVDMPLAEAVIVGSAVGLACSGMIPIPELQFLGFGSQAFHQIEGQVARYSFRSQGSYPMPMVIRAPFGGNVRTPELHSDAHEAKYVNSPGLKVVMPATARDAKGMLAEAIRDPDPVLFCEPLRGYRLIKDEVPEEDYTVPLGQGARRARGLRPRHRRLQRRGRHRRARRRARRARRATRSACSTCAAWCRSTSTRCARRSPRAGARSSCTRARSAPASAPSSWRRSRRRRSGRCRRRSAASPPTTRRTRRARSRSSTCRPSTAWSTRSARRWSA